MGGGSRFRGVHETHFNNLERSLRTLEQYRGWALKADDNTAKMDEVLRGLERCRDLLRQAFDNAPPFPDRLDRYLSDFPDVKRDCAAQFDQAHGTAALVLAQFPDWEDLE